MEPSIVKVEPTALAQGALDADGLPVEAIIARVGKIQAVQKRLMKQGEHFGVIPGTQKPTLLKPGAELLCLTFQLDPQFSIDESRDGDHLTVVVTCTLYHAPSGTRIGAGLGSCSTRESKYAFRKGHLACPDCGKEVMKSKQDPEWFCWRKKGGCGATFPLDDERITGQRPDRLANPDLPDTWNTVLKMGTKRALVAAVLMCVGASALFTQDVEDGAEPAPAPPPDPKAKPGDTPSEAELDAIVAAMGDVDSFEALEELRLAHTKRKWSRAQRKALGDAYTAAKESLAAEEALNPPDDPEDESLQRDRRYDPAGER